MKKQLIEKLAIRYNDYLELKKDTKNYDYFIGIIDGMKDTFDILDIHEDVINQCFKFKLKKYDNEIDIIIELMKKQRDEKKYKINIDLLFDNLDEIEYYYQLSEDERILLYNTISDLYFIDKQIDENDRIWNERIRKEVDGK